ncbi:uncharacterized protein A1O9_00006 [Exophiala aquamarina CBS 119918]|uniref:Major facilitator superfamily (MFS) profile domain-containing protein n=1 Tax=Exophiala aquamarina CBS 119918 TaxID=1182545 RepID=A0A072PPI9_9EURO|nr:uncharacterized protein A1O9_00006 [Exophiala aquamarina CBS 119918]KEF62034.1 hypothetical protein A1O9_00006 [Exophiala aquamarina CBS 119918]
MLEQAGIKSSREQILYNAILNTLSYLCATIAALFIAGRIDRRMIFITASLLFCLEFIIITVLTVNCSKSQYFDHPKINASKATVVFIFLFGLPYSLTFTPLHPIYPVECFSFETRVKRTGFYPIMDSIPRFFSTYITPIGPRRAHWKFYLLYIIRDALIPIVIYLFAVETHGRTLEEHTEIFRVNKDYNPKSSKDFYTEGAGHRVGGDTGGVSKIIVGEDEEAESRHEFVKSVQVEGRKYGTIQAQESLAFVHKCSVTPCYQYVPPKQIFEMKGSRLVAIFAMAVNSQTVCDFTICAAQDKRFTGISAIIKTPS